jgi:para-nitrobenzyl esterase
LVTGSILGGCSNARPSAILRTQAGAIQGEISADVHRFLGIPYAEPPFGALRFKAPERRKSWDGVLVADKFGAICPQPAAASGLLAHGEDCLNLNIWTPDPSATNLPVMVWMHGGDQLSGSGSQPLYDGSQFAREGVVLVTCNRRLGAESYLYLESAMQQGIGPGNLGVLDQMQVLHWIQENIAAFGGDAGNVTLFGQADGAVTLQALVATPAARGLAHRVIPQSGAYAAQRPETAQVVAELVLKQLGIKAGDLSALQAVPSAQLAALYPAVHKLQQAAPQPYLPVISESMPVHPADAAHAGFGLELDYLTGTCADEMVSAPDNATTVQTVHIRQYAERILAIAGVDRQRLLSTYVEQRPNLSPEQIETVMLGDVWARLPTLRVAHGHALRGSGKTYCYYFAEAAPAISAAHGSDLIIFGNDRSVVAEPPSAVAAEVGALMRRAWCNFARNGDPSLPELPWPEYNSKQQSTLRIGPQPIIIERAFADQSRILGTAMANNWQAMGL